MRIKIKGDFSDSANDWIDELMLNDWFLSQDGIDDTCEDVYEWEASKYSSFDDLNYVTENNIVLPLEITKEILELNNDELGSDAFSWRSCKNGGFIFSIHSTDCTFSSCDVSAQLKYVHELQNFLRACGFKEFANNFRIQ